MGRIAVISDIHGNRWALEAVLEDIEREGADKIVNLGDAVYGPLDPAGTADIIINRGIPTVRGNEDRLITDGGDEFSGTLAFVRDRLQEDHLEWLRSMRPSLTMGQISAFHGSPDSDTEYLLREVGPAGACPRIPEEVGAAVRGIGSSLILCGHDHVPGNMLISGGRTVVNPGSVGLQAFLDDVPYPHMMETGTPHARYSMVSRRGQGWTVTDRAVLYDWKAAAEEAWRNGRPDWAAWILTGRAENR